MAQPAISGPAGPSVATTDTDPSGLSSAVPAKSGLISGWISTPMPPRRGTAGPLAIADAQTASTAVPAWSGATPISELNAPASAGSSSAGDDDRTASAGPSGSTAAVRPASPVSPASLASITSSRAAWMPWRPAMGHARPSTGTLSAHGTTTDRGTGKPAAAARASPAALAPANAWSAHSGSVRSGHRGGLVTGMAG